jgi:4-hydroxy-tetrahydrodipicolinate reductase
MIRVCFAGITGWTAPPILKAVDAADDLRLISGVSRSSAGCRVADATRSRSEGLIYASVAEALDAAEADVLVDYTSASAVRQNVWTAVQAGVHVVVGSSGLTADDYTELDQLARNTGVGVVAAGNFSVMAAILQRAAVLAAAHLDHWEIVDYASAGKPDVPSGTARELGRHPGTDPYAGSGSAGLRRGWSSRSAWSGRCRHPNPLGAVAEFRGQHRNRLRGRRRAADHAP